MVHFQPADGYVGDPIPFFWQGAYHLFYLKRPSDVKGVEQLVWAHAVTKDWRDWEELPNAVEMGKKGDPDAEGCWTGSVVEKEGTFHIFYTGWNPKYPFHQTICHATSTDLIHWEKAPSNPILVPDERWYEATDWRDPFVFWNKESECWWMTITARARGDFPRRGCIALATSKALSTWEAAEPIWSPHVVNTPECTDLFSIGGQHYLIFSTVTTRYRVAENWLGMWMKPGCESFDGPQLYAAKAFHAPDRHLLVGWIPTREDERDEGHGHWGGCLSLPRELITKPNGLLGVLPAYDAFPEMQEGWIAEPKPMTGVWRINSHEAMGSRTDGFAAALADDVPADFAVRFSLTMRGPGARAGLLLRIGEGLDTGYMLVLDAAEQRMSIHHWQVWGDPIPLVSVPVEIEDDEPLWIALVLDGTVMEAFVEWQVSLACRTYNFRSGRMGLFVSDGEAHFSDWTWGNVGLPQTA